MLHYGKNQFVFQLLPAKGSQTLNFLSAEAAKDVLRNYIPLHPHKADEGQQPHG